VTIDAWDAARRAALRLPAAAEDHPWDEVIIKVRTKPGVPPWRKDGAGVLGPAFLWLGRRDAEDLAASVKLGPSYEEAVAIAGATPTTHSGLGQWGWLTVRLDAVELGLLEDWIEESYRLVAPRRLVAELDASSRTSS
jgi:hypothetical protein